jgi:hypothetical protein
MKIMYLLSHILFILAISLTPACHGYTKAVLMGTIKFPKDITSIDPIRIYCQGMIIPTETNNSTKTISFTLPFEEKRKTTFNLLITENIAYERAEENTIRYLKISPHQSHKFYALELIKDNNQKIDDFTFAHNAKDEKKKNQEVTYHWRIDEQKIEGSGRIPDDTIIVYYKPEYVDKLEDGNSVELPYIIIKDDIVKLAGSEANLHEKSTSLLLSSLDLDALHAPIHQEVKQEYQRSRVTMITT